MSPVMTYAEFETLLAVFGSDRTRWPVEARKAAAQLVAHDAAAARLLAEAEALDRVLDRAPLPTLAREAALTDRIVAAAQRSPRVVAGGKGAGATEARAGMRPQPAALRFGAMARAGTRFAMSKAGIGAALSAASLAAGILIGITNPSQTLLRPVQQLAGLALAGSGTAVGVPVDSLEEDLL